MPTIVKSRFHVKRIESIFGILLDKVFLRDTFHFTGIENMNWRLARQHLCPTNQTLMLRSGRTMFKIGPLVVNDVHIRRDILLDTKHLVFVAISTPP
ncbi:hypothetical protein ACHAXS_012153, partial [Conticribra weissflogii]